MAPHPDSTPNANTADDQKKPDGTLDTPLQWARCYVAGRVSVFPIALDGTKAPAGNLLPREMDPDAGKLKATWNPFREAPPADADLARWYGTANPPGIAAVCGAVSGGLAVLDFDNEAEALFSQWAELVWEADAELLAKVAVVRTPRPGYHVYLRSAEQPVPGSVKLACDPSKLPEERTLIETRGEGGYALLPGCPAACHETGRTYEHLDGPPIWDLKPLTGDERDTLMSAARAQDPTPPPLPKPPAPRAPGEGLRPGEDFDRRADVLDVLTGAGWKVWREAGEIIYLTRPGKERGVGASVGKVRGQDGTRLAHVFTSSADGLEGGKNYGPFNAYAALHHKGDHSAAAKALAAQGYGTPSQDAAAPLTSCPHPAAGSRPGMPPAALDLIEALDVPEPELWPVIGPDAYHGLAGEFVATIEPQTESDPVAVLVQLLVAVGNVVGRGPYLQIEGDRHCTNLYAMAVGDSAVARKGTSWSRVREVMRPAASQWSADCVVSGLTSGEGMIHHVRDPKGKDEGVADKRLMVEEPEFASVLKRMTQKENTLSAVMRLAWRTGNLCTLGKVSPAQATRAHVSIVGHITAAELKTYLTHTEMLNGFANRFLWVCVRQSKRLPFGGQRLDIAPFVLRL